MLEKFAARARNSGIDYQLLLPLLVSTALVQLLTSLVRVTTSYRAVELKLSIIWLGLIASAFAIVPILMAVRVGRFIDRGHDAHTTWIGSALFATACVGFALWSSAGGLLVCSAVIGRGQLIL